MAANGGAQPVRAGSCWFLTALEHCHRAGVCHRDLRLENLLFDRDFNLKLTDFKFSHRIVPAVAVNLKLWTRRGLDCYTPPEVPVYARHPRYDGAKADMVRMCTRHRPLTQAVSEATWPNWEKQRQGCVHCTGRFALVDCGVRASHRVYCHGC